MKVDEKVMNKALSILDKNETTIKRVETEVASIGCSWCANCSGIVGG